MEGLYYDDQLYELGWGFSKIIKRVKRAVKRVKKTVSKVSKKALYAASGVLGGAFGAAIYAADQYVSSYTYTPSAPATAARRPAPRQTYPRQSSYQPPAAPAKSDLNKYLPWLIGAGALLLLGRK